LSGDLPLLRLYAYVVWIGKTLPLLFDLFIYLNIYLQLFFTNSDTTASDTLKSAERVGSNV
jgi:hypothetical protein